MILNNIEICDLCMGSGKYEFEPAELTDLNGIVSFIDNEYIIDCPKCNGIGKIYWIDKMFVEDTNE